MLLAEEGMAALNVEAVARRAGFNKALVYRCFGGINGLLAAFAGSDGFLPDQRELGQGLPADPLAMPPRRRLAIVLKNYARALRRRPATVQILLHASASSAPPARALEAGRRPRIMEIREALGLTDEATGLDMDALMALFLSAFTMLVAREERAVDITRAEHAEMFWKRIEAVIDTLCGP